MKMLKPLILLLVLCISLTLPSCQRDVGRTPVISSFNAEPTSISANGKSILTWEVSGASRVSIEPGIGDVAESGRREVTPNTTTIYTLLATGASGSTARATVQVTVEGSPAGGVSPSPGAPQVVEFWAKPSNITIGESASLIWNVQNAASITIEPGIGSVNLQGARLVSPGSTTTYTLTATNAAGSTSNTTQVVVSGRASSGAGLPVINYFRASPTSITAGGSTTLSWDVSNATSIGISSTSGNNVWMRGVSASGSQEIRGLSTTTTLRLTASNPAGETTASATVTVSGISAQPLPIGKPDLVITEVDLVDKPDGNTGLRYTIKNQGNAAAGASITKLYYKPPQQDYTYFASDSVPPIGAGVSVTREFPDFRLWRYSRLHVDTTQVVDENNESNNVSDVDCTSDLGPFILTKAQNMKWQTGPPLADIAFGGNCDSDSKGCAAYRYDIKMEDGNTYVLALETHPKWVNDGIVEGYTTQPWQIKPHSIIKGTAGLIQGASNGSVVFEILIRPEGGNELVLYTVSDRYDSNCKDFQVIIPASYLGRNCYFGARVRANGASTQDWATWVNLALRYFTVSLHE